jgi:NAD(P)-dependent dehydrogenase (short-subunit alcohol dehydrogenase family)
MSLDLNFSGKLVLITGVTSGIGAGVAAMFARAGASVAGCGTQTEDSPPAIRFLQEAEARQTEALYVQADVTGEAQLEDFVKKALQRFGRIDVLVSNAGVNIFTDPSSCTEEDWQYNAELNLASHWRLARLCRPHLEKRQGVIIIMASNHAYATLPGCFPYNVTKTALTGLVRALAVEWGPAIRTVGLAPGFIETEASRRWFDGFPDAVAERRRTINLHPVKRLGTPEEVGGYCVFLASEYASFASGATYLLDGGRSAVMQDS